MRFRVVLLTLPLVAMAALHNHAALHRRATEVQVDIVTVTEIITVTVDATVSSAAAILTSASSVPGPSSSLTVEQPTSPEPAKNTTTAFSPLVPVSNSAMVKNSCNYPVYIWSVGNPTCDGPAAECKLIEPHGTHIETFRKCTKDGGVALKISKDKSAAKPMQFEYSIWKDVGLVSYDISYLDCMNADMDQKDLSECAGHEGGIQAVGGGDCMDFHCAPNEYCASQAYVVAEFGGLDGAPVGACPLEKGIAFELCAGVRG